MSNQTLALLILVFPAAGALLLAGRGWRLPRIFTVLVGPGVVWASFVCVLALFAGKAYALFALCFGFMIAGYSGAAPLVTRLPFFALVGVFGAGCGLLLTFLGHLLRTKRAGSAANPVS